ncbi:uncharacterized protein MICPUCDRAFT_2294, partial [Micromonas pusilla CCMP1545]
AEEYKRATPYAHGVVSPLCDDSMLRRVRAEMRDNLSATFKETDLFKVLQTVDLVTIDDPEKGGDPAIAAKIPALLRLRDAIYSQEFRDMVQTMTGCAPLTDRIDCSANVYPRSGHLLCHDDVIGTRCISYIVYLTDPDDAWTEKDGGALELYPVETPGTPAVDPTARLIPRWNSMAFFTVQPGRSFHAVQEVFAEDKPRLSISGWYHAATAPEGSENATLTQLQTRASEDDDVAGFVPFQSAEPLGPDEDDLAYLSRWVNPEYLVPENVARIRAKMEEDSSVQMREFLKPELANAIRAATRAEDARDALGRGAIPARTAGVGKGWRAIGPTHKQRFLRFDDDDDDAGAPDEAGAGALLRKLRADVFASEAFARLLTALTGWRPTAHKGDVRRFRPGLDYTVAHHGILTVDPRLDATLCVVDDEGEDDAQAWDFGECGGFECYIAADESGVASAAATAEVYKAAEEDDEDELLSVSATFNTLSLVARDEGLMRFVKYVSHLAPSSRWDLAMQYTVVA